MTTHIPGEPLPQRIPGEALTSGDPVADQPELTDAQRISMLTSALRASALREQSLRNQLTRTQKSLAEMLAMFTSQWGVGNWRRTHWVDGFTLDEYRRTARSVMAPEISAAHRQLIP